MADFAPNTLYYGDNLGVLRDFPPECVELIYLDPPFNSNRNYNVLFNEEQSGVDSEAQIQVFEGTWNWSQQGFTIWKTYNEIVLKQDAAGAGTSKDGWGKTYPKLQIITAADMVHGKTIDIPPNTAPPNTNHR